MSAKSRKTKEASWGVGMRRCRQCQRVLPLSQFLWNGHKRHFSVHGCNSCAAENMARYWRSHMVGKLPEEFEERED